MLRFLMPFLIVAAPALACGRAVCQVDPDSLGLPRVITFEDQRATMGPGSLINAPLHLEGAVIAERFVGQRLDFLGEHDVIEGPASAPLTPMAGQPGQTMSVVLMSGNRVLNGYGRSPYPSRDGQGEGAISVMFDTDQSAVAFDIRGGEGGHARVLFLRRDGSVIDDVPVARLSEHTVGFLRADSVQDIAGIVITNTDPQGLALDNIRFGHAQILG